MMDTNSKLNAEQEYSGARILVVEDQDSLRRAVQRFLESEGYTITTAGDGIEALDRMNEECPDIIVADIGMPRMDGYAFYEAVRSRQDGVQIPFIFLSARSDKAEIRRAKDLGAEDYIIKPFHPEDLAVAIRARLRRAHEIREATEAGTELLKEQIITVLNHELRKPLTYITGYLGIALEEANVSSADDLRNLLMGIKQGSDRLNRLVEDLLLVIHLDSGKAARDFAVLAHAGQDIREMTLRTVRQYEPQAEAKGVSLILDLNGAAPPLRLCEPFYCDALGRLVDNAIKFSRGNGKSVTVRSGQDDAWFTVSVADQGIGIKPEELPRIFERFRQIDRHLLEQQGVGLGLAIAQELIRLHGGDITAESEPGVGSVFTIRLPLM
ncbi:MAG: hybrid sensor histidine kinase/response regulator [Chloroflexi bacterium]|nr:hybrid sensor histidine kinase/response regulator [Chloroflexota bacterium]